MTVQEIVKLILEASSPENMAPEEALKFMQEIIMDLEPRCDALEEDMEDFK